MRLGGGVGGHCHELLLLLRLVGFSWGTVPLPSMGPVPLRVLAPWPAPFPLSARLGRFVAVPGDARGCAILRITLRTLSSIWKGVAPERIAVTDAFVIRWRAFVLVFDLSRGTGATGSAITGATGSAILTCARVSASRAAGSSVLFPAWAKTPTVAVIIDVAAFDGHAVSFRCGCFCCWQALVASSHYGYRCCLSKQL